ncbi:MAG: hypothetical protein FJ098_11380 [Deltaproteobacteria bacterium]|nr:hypothetical protein [Deltaproteobacteria bacterium]
MNRLILAALALFLLTPPSATAAELDLSKGTMQAGGTATFDIEMMMPDKGDSTTGFLLDLAPSFGYFLIDRLELFAGLNFMMGFGDHYKNAAKNLGFSVGAKYFFPLGAVTLYAGLGVGMGFMLPDKGDTMKDLAIGVPLGVLLPFNEHVGLDLGTTVSYSMSLDDGPSSLNIPIGYLGVQSFF